LPFFTRLFASLTLLASLAGASAQAQNSGYTALTADNVTFNAATGLMNAKGHVVVIFDQTTMEADSLSYNRLTGDIKANGPLRITDASGAVFTATTASLNADMTTGIIRGAQLLLANRFQIAAAEIRRSEGRFNTLYRTVASTCSVDSNRPVPLWQIRAERIVHDTEARRLYFEDAQLEAFGLPIAYMPHLRLPDPSVDRASGLLYPRIISSDIYGYGIKLPYYLTFGDHADATITPFLMTNGGFLIDTEFRKRYANGHLKINGALALNGSANDAGEGFITADIAFSRPNGAELFLDLALASDDAFLRRYGYNNADRLQSQFGLRRYRSDNLFEISGVFFQSLRDDEVDAEVPFALPQINYRKTWKNSLFGGQTGLEASTVALFRQVGRDVFHASASADWRRDWSAPLGLRATTFAELRADMYRVWGDPAFGNSPLYRVTPSIGGDISLPLSKSTKNGALLVLSPIAQLLYTPEFAFNDAVPNEDSLQVEFDATNLFGLSRFPGEDRIETGLRANVGVSFRGYDPSGWTIGADIGQVIRLSPSSQFSTGTGLSGKTSDLLAALSFELPEEMRLASRVLVSPSTGIRRVEGELALNFDRLDLAATYLFLAADIVAGSPDDRSEANISTTYRISDKWTGTAALRRDLRSGSNIYGEIGLAFSNECLEVAVSLSRRFTASNNAPPDTNFDVSIKLAGFGGGSRQTAKAGTCLQMQ
jgi:LPS-assembly protein